MPVNLNCFPLFTPKSFLAKQPSSIFSRRRLFDDVFIICIFNTSSRKCWTAKWKLINWHTSDDGTKNDHVNVVRKCCNWNVSPLLIVTKNTVWICFLFVIGLWRDDIIVTSPCDVIKTPHGPDEFLYISEYWKVISQKMDVCVWDRENIWKLPETIHFFLIWTSESNVSFPP